jgi:hypothetical protein
MDPSEQTVPEVPEKFRPTIVDFCSDLSTTFPEFAYLWKRWTDPACPDEEMQHLYFHCLTVYPERFFDILNQNAELFSVENTDNTAFLPNVEFKMLFNCQGVSEKTRQTIWKYLQVILFIIVGSVKDSNQFGDAATNLFDGIDESELQSKLTDAMASIATFFQGSMDPTGEGLMDPTGEGSGAEGSGAEGSGSEDPMDPNMQEAFEKAFSFMNHDEGSSKRPEPRGPSGVNDLPKPEDIHDHLKNLFEGKIGSLAKELAEDIGQDLADSLGGDLSDLKSTKDVFAKLMQNPQKISGLVKTVGEKLNQKMAAGDISKEDIMNEAGEMMRRMKDMGGVDQFANMFKSMAKGMGVNIPKGAKLDTNALKQMEQKMSARDKLKARADAKKQRAALEKLAEDAKLQKQMADYQAAVARGEVYSMEETGKPDNYVFSLKGQEKQAKSAARPPSTTTTEASIANTVVEPIVQPLTANQKKKLKKKEKAKKEKEASATAL